MKKAILSLSLLFIFSLSFSKQLPEMVIGKKDIDPGITLIFEGAIKDDVSPTSVFLAENESDIHIEVLANWNEASPRGAPEGGFVAYLNISATVINQRTDQSVSLKLMPHLNMSDNFHYAQNIKLPGQRKDLYKVIFKIEQPGLGEIGMHLDWRTEVGKGLIEPIEYNFADLNFYEIAKASRR